MIPEWTAVDDTRNFKCFREVAKSLAGERIFGLNKMVLGLVVEPLIRAIISYIFYYFT